MVGGDGTVPRPPSESPATSSILRRVSRKSQPWTRCNRLKASPAPQPLQIHVPRPPRSSKRKRSLPPQLGQGPCLFRKNFSAMPRCMSTLGQRPAKREWISAAYNIRVLPPLGKPLLFSAVTVAVAANAKSMQMNLHLHVHVDVQVYYVPSFAWRVFNITTFSFAHRLLAARRLFSTSSRASARCCSRRSLRSLPSLPQRNFGDTNGQATRQSAGFTFSMRRSVSGSMGRAPASHWMSSSSRYTARAMKGHVLVDA